MRVGSHERKGAGCRVRVQYSAFEVDRRLHEWSDSNTQNSWIILRENCMDLRRVMICLYSSRTAQTNWYHSIPLVWRNPHGALSNVGVSLKIIAVDVPEIIIELHQLQ